MWTDNNCLVTSSFKETFIYRVSKYLIGKCHSINLKFCPHYKTYLANSMNYSGGFIIYIPFGLTNCRMAKDRIINQNHSEVLKLRTKTIYQFGNYLFQLFSFCRKLSLQSNMRIMKTLLFFKKYLQKIGIGVFFNEGIT